ncbi:eukaryotic mitochondrial regulator protein-domain-containing protein [Coniochaeta sp. 2T2.1]|nr:eukaryotic mitochondrial regulator protein-domain-containing protein [Coniochaeta sp. 2T2.1]
MPPRLPSRALVAGLETAATPSCCCLESSGAQQAKRSFASTSQRQGLTRPRLQMRQWMQQHGEKHREHREPGPSYLMGSNKKPFPNNPFFVSEPVLSEDSREEIWRKVVQEGEAIKSVSANYGVDMRRVAAVVRLKEVEKAWEREGKKLATPYARAVMDMLPSRTIVEGQEFEPINEIHVHSYTQQQLFLPTSESRHFTREDAAKAFGDHILPADKRVPHPELINLEKDLLAGKSPEEAKEAFEKAAMDSEVATATKEQKRLLYEERQTTRVKASRFEFRFKKINVEDVGKDGRSRLGTGYRYGVPFYDRRRGQVKIPTKVE